MSKFLAEIYHRGKFGDVKLATNIDELVLQHIMESSFWSDDFYPLGGFHLDPKPKEAKIDVVEINQLTNSITEVGVRGVVNINIMHTDVLRIKQLSHYIKLIMEDALIHGCLFNLEQSNNFKRGKNIFFENLRFRYNISFLDIPYELK